ncbi:hypothetical protein OOT00_03700 [Desulfobotulus sp. H1]|uniref:Solute-binding protein family 3/N-terminal domain-containing protein n=1 Tax=Desulfobotulus pelophilus TaxID=2823377 RepID=A0ABT3N6K7_9BACT|nr:hypothetical protein [Desulfobotulus pelophilus]MCW7753088.1 hypothetical protein [Desulfobotulus pelophilus]
MMGSVRVSILISSMLLIAMALFVSAVCARETVRVVGHQYTPYQNQDQSGFQNDLVKAAFDAVGLQADIAITPPFRTIQDFYNCRYAVSADGETLEDEIKNRELDVRKHVYWNVPIGLMYYKPNLTEAERKALESVSDFSQINPEYSILSYGGYDPYTPEGFQGKVDSRSHSPEQTMMMIKGNRYKLGFEVLGVTPYTIMNSDDPADLKNWGFVNAWVFVPQYMAFKGKDPKGAYYEEKFLEGLRAIKANGVYLDIYEKLYGKNNVPSSAVDDPHGEIRKEDLGKLVKDAGFDMEKFLRQERDASGSIVRFVE